MSDADDLQAQLDDIDSQLRTLRGETGGLTDQVGGQDDGPQEAEDNAAALTNQQENDALIGALQARRETVAAKLAAAG